MCFGPKATLNNGKHTERCFMCTHLQPSVQEKDISLIPIKSGVGIGLGQGIMQSCYPLRIS